MSTTAIRDDDIRHLYEGISELVAWKHSVGSLCPERIGTLIFRLSVVCLRIMAAQKGAPA